MQLLAAYKKLLRLLRFIKVLILYLVFYVFKFKCQKQIVKLHKCCTIINFVMTESRKTTRSLCRAFGQFNKIVVLFERLPWNFAKKISDKHILKMGIEPIEFIWRNCFKNSFQISGSFWTVHKVQKYVHCFCFLLEYRLRVFLSLYVVFPFLTSFHILFPEFFQLNNIKSNFRVFQVFRQFCM